MLGHLSNSHRIANKLFYGIILFLVLALGSLGSLIIRQRLKDARIQMENNLISTTNTLAQVLPLPVENLNAKQIRSAIELSSTDGLQTVEIFDASGQRVYVYERAGKESAGFDRIIERQLLLQEKSYGKFIAYFSLGSPMRELKLREFLRLIILISSAGLILGAGLYYLVQRLILKPIQETLMFSESLAEGEYGRRIEIRSEDEMGMLQKSLNKMADALEESLLHLKTSVIEAQRAHQEVEEASRLKSEFLANISHEIRTPLHAIIGFTNLLNEEEAAPERKKNLETILQSANDLLEHLNDILDFSKMEVDKLSLVMEYFHLPSLIEEITRSIELRLKNKPIQFKTVIAEELKKNIEGDRTRLRQVLLNLLINATKFTQKGTIELDISRVPGNREILFQVRDTGIGISKGDQERIFEPFIQADASFTKKHGGFGLGLSIVKRLVELMEGKIWLESEVGQGTTFYCMIPMG